MRDTKGELVRVRRLVEDGERRVVAQKELAERLRAGGHSAAEAEEVILRSMDDALRKMRQHLRDVCK